MIAHYYRILSLCVNVWQNEIKTLITDPNTLLNLLELDTKDLSFNINRQFPLRVPHSFVQKMRKGDPHDPLLLQVLVQPIESLSTEGFSNDPLQEKIQQPLPGLIQKFNHRILITLTGSCAIHCRYCFRRHFPYQDNPSTGKHWSKLFEYIQKNNHLNEVIFSGGDPLMCQNHQIKKAISDLNSLKHIRVIRFHTRLPVVIPNRIDNELLTILHESTTPITMVYHINHPNECCKLLKKNVKQLNAIGINVFNQTVLLKDINDCAKTLQELSFTLYSCGIIPYYVHLLDKVQGAAHFDVARNRAKELYKACQATLPGYLLPRFVEEIPGKTSKIPLQIT